MPRSTQKASAQELDIARRVVAGDEEAKALFYQKYHPVVAAALALRAREPTTKRGITEVTLELMGDCVKTPSSAGAVPSGQSLLEKYLRPTRRSQACGASLAPPEIGPLEAWLKRVAFNRFHDWLEDNHLLAGSPVVDHEPAEEAVGPEESIRDEESMQRMRAALLHGFEEAARLQPLGLVSLRLAWIHQVQIRQIAVAWSRHQANVTPYMHRAMEIIRKETLRYLRRDDPAFILTWEDLLAVFARYPEVTHSPS